MCAGGHTVVIDWAGFADADKLDYLRTNVGFGYAADAERLRRRAALLRYQRKQDMFAPNVGVTELSCRKE